MKKITKALIDVANETVIHAPNHLRIGEYHPAFGGAFLGIRNNRHMQPNYALFKAHGDNTAETVAAFGNRGGRVEGADDDDDGLANTLALVNSGIAHPSAEFARSYTQDGFSDFFLPSPRDLRLGLANCPELFKKDASYWTSKQYRGNDDCAWVQHFGSNGVQWHDNKGNERRVCPVRRVLIIQ